MTLKTFSQELAEWTRFNLLNCIGVDECMKVCPAVDPALTIKELNEASRPGAALSPETLKFAADCVQCGRCDTICPTVAGRSIMMLSVKENMAKAGQAPLSHKNYFKLKGRDKSGLRQGAFNTFIKGKWKFSDKFKSEKLARHIDKTEFNKAEYLFYFGCYIFTGERSAAQCVDIADKVGMDYEVLGGLKSCCGWPSLMAGRTGEAEDFHLYLKTMVEKSSPKFVITGCAECYMSLNKIKVKYDMDFTALTTPMWLEEFADQLGFRHDSEPVTYHDSCHISRKSGMPEPARKFLNRLNPITEMERSGSADTYCCGYWALGANPDNLKAIHKSRLDEAASTGAKTMVAECITCVESFSKSAEGAPVKVIDIVEHAYERMNIK